MLRKIETASSFLREGGLVVFPTETVYGLGADAFNANAVARIYSEKGRPGDNPLILHIASIEDFKRLAFNPPEYAFALIEAYWPGPLTLVARKNPDLPDWLGGHPTGKTETVGIRMPAHKIAQALIECTGIIAAPSANKAGRPSPTTLAHVLEDFPANEIMTLDGGSSIVGLESTVVDITRENPVILRLGAITEEEIRKIVSVSKAADSANETAPRSPGMKYKHYAPRAEMIILHGERENIASYILNNHLKTGVLVSRKTAVLLENSPPNIKLLVLGDDEKTIAQNLFSCLRECDRLGVEIIFAEAVAEKGLGAAIMDRMCKAAEGRIINV
jgi:L-threonylcarbamoyladenylate synthase